MFPAGCSWELPTQMDVLTTSINLDGLKLDATCVQYQGGEICSSKSSDKSLLLWQVRRRSQPDSCIVYRNAKFNIGRASCNSIPWKHSSSSSCMLSSCHGYHGPLSCLFLGEGISNPRLAVSTNSANGYNS